MLIFLSQILTFDIWLVDTNNMLLADNKMYNAFLSSEFVKRLTKISLTSIRDKINFTKYTSIRDKINYKIYVGLN